MEKILDRDFKYPVTNDDSVKSLIDQLTEMNPQNRIGLKDIDAIKNHPYFDGVDFESIRNQTVPRPPLPATTVTSDPSKPPLLPIPSFSDPMIAPGASGPGGAGFPESILIDPRSL